MATMNSVVQAVYAASGFSVKQTNRIRVSVSEHGDRKGSPLLYTQNGHQAYRVEPCQGDRDNDPLQASRVSNASVLKLRPTDNPPCSIFLPGDVCFMIDVHRCP